MRSMQGTDDQASVARYRLLPVWLALGVVAIPGNGEDSTADDLDHRRF